MRRRAEDHTKICLAIPGGSTRGPLIVFRHTDETVLNMLDEVHCTALCKICDATPCITALVGGHPISASQTPISQITDLQLIRCAREVRPPESRR